MPEILFELLRARVASAFARTGGDENPFATRARPPFASQVGANGAPQAAHFSSELHFGQFIFATSNKNSLDILLKMIVIPRPYFSDRARPH